ncbi:MAG: transcription-repair coupling factor, partial [Pseudomonadota bacterium]|nr:transcription-repair coupling factor [Pseudomonadota bacterium]
MLERIDLGRPQTLTLANVPDGMAALVAADLARLSAASRGTRRGPDVVLVARDGPRMAAWEEALGFFGAEIETLTFPAWDGMPYDRISPSAEISARRVATLSRLGRLASSPAPLVLLTTVNAIVQCVPPRALMSGESFAAAPGNRVDMDRLVHWLEGKGYLRTSTVRETGEYAVRGGILDLFAPGTEAPVRLDFFGDTLESIRSFDPESQRTTGQLRRLELLPMSEVLLSPEAITRFRQGYV